MPLLVSDQGKLKISASGQLADKNCCCAPPACPSVTLVCDKASVIQTRCGFLPLIPAGTYPQGYATATHSDCRSFGSYLDTAIGSDLADDNARFLTITSTLNGCDSSVETPSACPSVGTLVIIQTFDPIACVSNDETDDGELQLTCRPGDPCDNGDPVSGGCGNVGDVVADITSVLTTRSVELSDEYTDALLFANAASSVPAYPETWTGDCVAGSGFLAENHLQYAFAKIRYKFTTTIPLGCKLIILWNETFVPNSGDPTTTAKSWTYDHGSRSHTGGEPAEIGDNVGCTLDDPLESDIYEIVPGDNVDGSYIITDIRWSFSNGYTPSADTPEGFDTFAGTDQNCVPAL